MVSGFCARDFGNLSFGYLFLLFTFLLGSRTRAGAFLVLPATAAFFLVRDGVSKRPCDGVEFERFASSGKRHKTCTTCKADRTLRKAASALRLLVNPEP